MKTLHWHTHISWWVDISFGGFLWGAVQAIIHSGTLTHIHSPFTYIYFCTHTHIHSPYTHIHSPYTHIHSPYTHIHSPYTHIHSPYTHIHSPYTHIHSPYTHIHSPYTHIHSPYTHIHSPCTHNKYTKWMVSSYIGRPILYAHLIWNHFTAVFSRYGALIHFREL